MKNLFLVLIASLFSMTVYAASITIQPGETITVSPSNTTTVTCGSSTTDTLCVNSTAQAETQFKQCTAVYGSNTKCFTDSVMKTKPADFCQSWADFCFKSCQTIYGGNTKCVSDCSF
jgi:hypothetical protein